MFKHKKTENVFEPIFGIIFTGFFLLIINLFWYIVPFLSPKFSVILPIYNFSLFVSICLNASRIIIRNRFYKWLTDIVNFVFFAIIAYLLWVIYPFNPSALGNPSFWNLVFRFFIVVPPILMAFGIFVNFLKITFGRS